MKANIVLTGIMGAGKTTVGKALAEILSDYDFIDADDVIVEKSGLTIPEIFAKYSEEYFRYLETSVLRELSEKEGLVIALGGGAFENPENRKNLKQGSKVIYLKGTPEELFNRIKSDTNRPLLQCDNPQEKLADLLEQREPNYLQADIVIDTDGKDVEDIAQEIAELLK